MNTQFDVTSYTSTPAEPPKEIAAGAETVLLMRQLVDMQREQLALLRAAAMAHDAGTRWRAFVSRWKEEFPELPEGSREAIVVLERTYATMLAELVDHVRQNGGGELDSDFSLQEFLDKYGMRLAQLGTILNLIGPLAEASSQGESS